MADLELRRQGRDAGSHSTHGFGHPLLRQESLKNPNPMKLGAQVYHKNSQGGLTHLNTRLAE